MATLPSAPMEDQAEAQVAVLLPREYNCCDSFWACLLDDYLENDDRCCMGFSAAVVEEPDAKPMVPPMLKNPNPEVTLPIKVKTHDEDVVNPEDPSIHTSNTSRSSDEKSDGESTLTDEDSEWSEQSSEDGSSSSQSYSISHQEEEDAASHSSSSTASSMSFLSEQELQPKVGVQNDAEQESQKSLGSRKKVQPNNEDATNSQKSKRSIEPVGDVGGQPFPRSVSQNELSQSVDAESHSISSTKHPKQRTPSTLQERTTIVKVTSDTAIVSKKEEPPAKEKAQANASSLSTSQSDIEGRKQDQSSGLKETKGEKDVETRPAKDKAKRRVDPPADQDASRGQEQTEVAEVATKQDSAGTNECKSEHALEEENIPNIKAIPSVELQSIAKAIASEVELGRAAEQKIPSASNSGKKSKRKNRRAKNKGGANLTLRRNKDRTHQGTAEVGPGKQAAQIYILNEHAAPDGGLTDHRDGMQRSRTITPGESWKDDLVDRIWKEEEAKLEFGATDEVVNAFDADSFSFQPSVDDAKSIPPPPPLEIFTTASDDWFANDDLTLFEVEFPKCDDRLDTKAVKEQRELGEDPLLNQTKDQAMNQSGIFNSPKQANITKRDAAAVAGSEFPVQSSQAPKAIEPAHVVIIRSQESAFEIPSSSRKSSDDRDIESKFSKNSSTYVENPQVAEPDRIELGRSHASAFNAPSSSRKSSDDRDIESRFSKSSSAHVVQNFSFDCDTKSSFESAVIGFQTAELARSRLAASASNDAHAIKIEATVGKVVDAEAKNKKEEDGTFDKPIELGSLSQTGSDLAEMYSGSFDDMFSHEFSPSDKLVEKVSGENEHNQDAVLARVRKHLAVARKQKARSMELRKKARRTAPKAASAKIAKDSLPSRGEEKRKRKKARKALLSRLAKITGQSKR